MKRKLRNIFIVLSIAALAILFWKVFFDHQSQNYWDSLLGSLFGTFAGAAIIFIYQVRLERTRYFQSFFDKGQEIVAELTAWKLKKNKWFNVEFRNAVGLAKWDNNPDECWELNIENFEDCKSIEWHGIAYRIDNNFCVASKSIQEYTKWYQSLMAAYNVNLLTEYHIKMMWRLLSDPLYPTGKFTQKNYPGMRKWLEYFILGSTVYDQEDFKKISINEYNQYLDIRKVIDKYKPSQIRYSNKLKEWGLSEEIYK